MLLWGGYPNDGGRYDPLTDLWRPMTTVNAPAFRYDPTLVWTGQEAIAWGGANLWGNQRYAFNNGGRYIAWVDADHDGIYNQYDSCPQDPNPAQEDIDSDGLGDACEFGAALADADNSLRVDGLDLALLGRAFGSIEGDPRYDARVDLNRDGVVDGDDLALLASYWGESVSV
jgi:hypothetical protein